MPCRARARRVAEAMLQMKKFDIARLEQAHGATAASSRRGHASENENIHV